MWVFGGGFFRWVYPKKPTGFFLGTYPGVWTLKIRKSSLVTLTFNLIPVILHAVVEVHVHTKFHQAVCSGSWIIVVTKTKKNSAGNNTVVATADSNNNSIDKKLSENANLHRDGCFIAVLPPTAQYWYCCPINTFRGRKFGLNRKSSHRILSPNEFSGQNSGTQFHPNPSTTVWVISMTDSLSQLYYLLPSADVITTSGIQSLQWKEKNKALKGRSCTYFWSHVYD